MTIGMKQKGYDAEQEVAFFNIWFSQDVYNLFKEALYCNPCVFYENVKLFFPLNRVIYLGYKSVGVEEELMYFVLK